MTPSRDISRLLEIMAALRDPESGCPWDVEQTFATIAPYTIEEAYEVADAIERNDMVDLADELGDLLLQVVFHARMAEEAGEFSFGDVVEAITRKMVRRHPHVFGDETVHGHKLAKGMWEKIKTEEKDEKAALRAGSGPSNGGETRVPSLLDEVPRALPALMRAIKLQKRAARVGFDWDTAPPILEKIEEEIGELKEAMDASAVERIKEEYGDLLFSIVNLGRHLDLEPEAALESANLKFLTRFKFIETRLAATGRTTEDATLSEMEALWQQAKTATN
ncbi:nucleoside triphosphate pyrophosphohydrolase [Oricola cellulosilytica]|uniref:Nucleoside triphosphate pyrophosphohydrolase n=1 Tax=Oricola cellulosilytica TaxID=1429082 RepID=A0A4R0P7X9_9HYPH|nr:nucleoside triphosphate pyrophosphohydrolase [Oricola cellulosilytica]TCD13151.1 nucleoside triphosphate pyrophosphohydrolase [Oricola cellulosilytica]